ncbi:alanine dehydrogenase [Candidatus Micrarchaeota archaeon]|nr:alanine dehydrogenase [Candidatus Micrarchaeota archaeon]MBU1939727.1 alanine dehydrogenase [Candidatus Micrarchaeota archaeon]
MNVGVLREIKDKENRVALTPEGAKQLVDAGHSVFFERKCGSGSGIRDKDFEAVGAQKIDEPKALVDKCDLILKVKEPVESEPAYFSENKILFTYLHYASSCELTKAMLKSGAATIAYETIEDESGKLPLLIPMSEVSGRMSVYMGAYYLMKHKGGKGILMSGVTGVEAANVVIVGGGTAGSNAAQIASAMGAKLTVFDINEKRIAELKQMFPKANVIKSAPDAIADAVKSADVLIGAVLVPGAKAPKVVTTEMVHSMKNGSVVIDIAIDQGGCIETSRPTSHSGPTYEVGGITHYCVTNMPGAFPRTSTYALNHATLPYILKLAEKGLGALKDDKGFMLGLNTYKGRVTNRPVAETFGMEYVGPGTLI